MPRRSPEKGGGKISCLFIRTATSQHTVAAGTTPPTPVVTVPSLTLPEIKG
ncbi:MAG: hypothetical protein M0Z37_06080 [Nitrospiraceae bacterium]|nr:hypothetical protein [Nitrospiraceae bacterium]